MLMVTATEPTARTLSVTRYQNTILIRRDSRGTAAGSQFGVAKSASIVAVKVLSDAGSGSVADMYVWAYLVPSNDRH